MSPSQIHLFLDIHDKLLERSLKELFDPLPDFFLSGRDSAHLIISDHPVDTSEDYLLLDKFPLNTERLLRAIEFKINNLSMVFGDNKFTPASRVLHTPQGDHSLPDKEAQLLVTLLNANGETISKEELLKQVWNYSPNIDTHTLETHIYRLRQKIESDPANPVLLKNTEDGYCLVVG